MIHVQLIGGPYDGNEYGISPSIARMTDTLRMFSGETYKRTVPIQSPPPVRYEYVPNDAPKQRTHYRT